MQVFVIYVYIYATERFLKVLETNAKVTVVVEEIGDITTSTNSITYKLLAPLSPKLISYLVHYCIYLCFLKATVSDAKEKTKCASECIN